MRNTAATHLDETFGDWLAPQPTQDSDLLKQVGFVPGLKEILLLRQVHALEHATVWILGELLPPLRERWDSTTDDGDVPELGGLSTPQGFYLYGSVETAVVNQAVRLALRRITQGEWNLALHPRCGTNLSVGMLLAAGFALGLHCVLPRSPLEQLLGLGLATTTAAHLAPDLGQIAQQYITTAIPFNLSVEAVLSLRPGEAGEGGLNHRPAHFVRVIWRDV